MKQPIVPEVPGPITFTSAVQKIVQTLKRLSQEERYQALAEAVRLLQNQNLTPDSGSQWSRSGSQVVQVNETKSEHVVETPTPFDRSY